MSEKGVSEQGLTTPLLERGTELDVIRDAMAQAASGGGSLVLVEGPAGIGKTRLLEEAAEIAAGEGFVVRTGRGGEMERDLPFGVVRQLFEPLLARASSDQRDEWLAGSARRALVALGEGDQQRSLTTTDPYAAINGLYWLAANIAARQPLLLILDDAQWADGASLRFATFLARRLMGLPIAMTVGIRTGEPGSPPDLGALRLESAPLQPGPLSRGSVRKLIEGQTGAVPSEGFSDACTRASAGNPFFVMEILRELVPMTGVLDDEAAAAIEELVPEHVTRTVLFRLARFGQEAIALARAISVLGRAPQLRHVAELAGLDVAHAREISDELRRAVILAPGLPIEFVHPLVRQAIYLEQAHGERSVAHRRAAGLLAATGASRDDAAAHLLACEPAGDEWVVARLEATARAAMDEGAYDAAITHLERALLEPPDDDLEILYLLGRAVAEIDVFRAPEILAEVAERATDPTFRFDVLWSLAAAYIFCGQLGAAAETYDRAGETVRERDRELWLNAEAARHLVTWASGSRDREMTERIEQVAGSLEGASFGERVARQALATDRYLMCGPLSEFVELMHPAPEPAWKPVSRDMQSPVPTSAAKLLSWSGRWDDARQHLDAIIKVLHKEGRLLPLSLGYSLLAETDRLSGRLRESEAHARTAWEIAQLPGNLSAFQWSALMNLAATLLARGSLEGFLDLTRGFDLSLGPVEVPVNPFPIELRAHAHLAQGDLESAAEDFLALGAGLESITFLNPAYPPWRQEATEVLAALGRTAEARELVSVAEERAQAFGAQHVIGGVLRARAFTEPRSAALETLGRSVKILEASGPPHELARSLIELGAALRRDGRRRAAQDALRRALDLAARCGAGGLERRARAELAAAGARPRRAAMTGVGALTGSELRTAALAAEGLSNKEIAERLFVTMRTVEAHLTSAYAKLAIAGRRELSAALSSE